MSASQGTGQASAPQTQLYIVQGQPQGNATNQQISQLMLLPGNGNTSVPDLQGKQTVINPVLLNQNPADPSQKMVLLLPVTGNTQGTFPLVCQPSSCGSIVQPTHSVAVVTSGQGTSQQNIQISEVASLSSTVAAEEEQEDVSCVNIKTEPLDISHVDIKTEPPDDMECLEPEVNLDELNQGDTEGMYIKDGAVYIPSPTAYRLMEAEDFITGVPPPVLVGSVPKEEPDAEEEDYQSEDISSTSVGKILQYEVASELISSTTDPVVKSKSVRINCQASISPDLMSKLVQKAALVLPLGDHLKNSKNKDDLFLDIRKIVSSDSGGGDSTFVIKQASLLGSSNNVQEGSDNPGVAGSFMNSDVKIECSSDHEYDEEIITASQEQQDEDILVHQQRSTSRPKKPKKFADDSDWQKDFETESEAEVRTAKNKRKRTSHEDSDAEWNPGRKKRAQGKAKAEVQASPAEMRKTLKKKIEEIKLANVADQVLRDIKPLTLQLPVQPPKPQPLQISALKSFPKVIPQLNSAVQTSTYKPASRTLNHPWLQSLSSGLNQQITKKIQTCDDCGMKFISYKVLYVHKSMHKNNRFRCDECGFITENRREGVRHLDLHDHTVKVLECKVCHQKFSHVANYLHHTLEHREKSKLLVKCSYCKKLISRYMYHTHLNKHKNIVKFECEQCGKGFCEREKMKDHVNSIHTGNKPYQCNLCGKLYSQRCSLDYHVRTHSENRKPFKCDVCGKAFSSRYTSLSHKHRKHGGNPPVICMSCGEAFPEQMELMQHACTNRAATSTLKLAKGIPVLSTRSPVLPSITISPSTSRLVLPKQVMEKLGSADAKRTGTTAQQKKPAAVKAKEETFEAPSSSVA